jgi:hypothetical protein
MGNIWTPGSTWGVYKWLLTDWISHPHSDNMPPTNHPNIDLHNQLVEAAKNKTLDAEYIKKCLDLPTLPYAERDATAYVNWSTTLSLLGPAPANVWFAGVSKPGTYSSPI